MHTQTIPFIKELLQTKQPKISTLKEDEQKLYRGALAVLGMCVPENFFDMLHLPHHNYMRLADGLYYSICYFDDEQLWSMSNKRSLLVVYQIKDHSSFCPFRIEVQHNFTDHGFVDVNNYKIICVDQSGQRDTKKNLVHMEEGELYTQIPNHMELTLSQLMNFSNHSAINQ